MTFLFIVLVKITYRTNVNDDLNILKSRLNNLDKSYK